MCSPKPPGAPTPPSVADQTKGNIATATAQERLNNFDQINPYGSVKYTSGDTFDEKGYNSAVQGYESRRGRDWISTMAGAGGESPPGVGEGYWKERDIGAAPTRADYTILGRNTQTQSFSPEEQKIFNANQQNRLKLNETAGESLDKVRGILGTGIDYSGAPAAPDTQNDALRKKVMDAMLSRSDPALGRANSQQDADLIAAGIRPGTEAWDRVKGEQGRNRNDMLMQAELAGGNAAQQEFGMGTEARRNYISELLSKRSVPLNEITALMSGQQTQNPFANSGGGGGGTQVKGNDYFSGANMLNQYNQDIYNQQVGTNNSRLGAVAQLGAGALTYY